MAPQPITGAHYPRGGGGGILPHPPVRLEIHDFVKNEKYFSLYIQALDKMYSDPSNQLFSWYQVSGIHALPYVNWNDAPGGTTGGYCEHGTPIFSTWHRPYVALIEQVLQQYALTIAKTYKVNKQDWITAAEELRQPFWDWGLPSPSPPEEVVSLDKVEITLPDGSRNKVPNPLTGFKFHSAQDIATFQDWADTPKTVRQPDNLGPNAETNLTVLREKLKVSRTDKTRRLLLEVHDWQSFSTAAVPKDDNVFAFTDSLEAIHGSVHNFVGGIGHMGHVPVAGFDPIFFMHHCQVDRILSLWAALNPGVWVPPNNVNKDLSPFWNTTNTFWTSAELTAHRVLNYSYPEFKDFDGTPEQLKEHIKAIVNKLYPGQTDQTLQTVQALQAPQTVQALQTVQTPQVVSKWTARIRCKQHEVDRSFAIPIVIHQGQAGEPILAGSGDFFVNSDRERCANCIGQVREGLVTQTFVHLDSVFADIGLHEKSDSEKVDHLKENLHWHVEKLDGNRVELPSLEITVMKTPVEHGRHGDLPTAGQPTYFPEITRGRTGLAG